LSAGFLALCLNFLIAVAVSLLTPAAKRHMPMRAHTAAPWPATE
jgi:hypothetical protein